jgi:putative ubiquitin-RnfH superfamily antitoxin RatB of RatAB toxin-antitoxin module
MLSIMGRCVDWFQAEIGQFCVNRPVEEKMGQGERVEVERLIYKQPKSSANLGTQSKS